MSNYTQNTYFAPKDALTTGDPLKKIKGTEVDAELLEISTSIATKEDTANRGAANGYAPLNASSLLADTYLTSNVPLLNAATNAFTGNLSVAGTLSMGGGTVWTSANDGAASGLDADLLDGVQGASYLQTANLLTAMLAVDGPGSGLDADTLDTYHASSFLLSANLLTAILAVDGSGSGIDADLLDGSQGSAFAKYADATANFTGTLQYGGIEVGYRSLPALTGTGGTATTAWRGKSYQSTGGVTIPASTFAAGDIFVIYNNTASSMTITRGTSLTMYYYGTDSATVSLGAHDTLTCYFVSATVCVVK